MVTVQTELLQYVLLGSTGALAGLHGTLSCVTIPALLKSSDPTPSFKWLTRPIRIITLNSVVATSLSGSILFFQLQNPLYVPSILLTILILPQSYFMMEPTQKLLLDLKGNLGKETEIAKIYLGRWVNRQWFRTALATGAFGFALFAVINRRSNLLRFLLEMYGAKINVKFDGF